MSTPFPAAEVRQQNSLSVRLASPGTVAALPPHWQNDFALRYGPCMGKPLEILFSALCLVSVGRKSLDQQWRELHSGDDKYRAHMDRIIYRFTSMNTMIGLLLASMAALITTEAPKSKILNYTIRGPYLCLWTSFALLLGAAVVGSTGVFVMSACTAEWTEQVIMASRPRVICLLITLAYPFLAVGVSTVLCAFGLLVAAWQSEDGIARKGCVFLFLVPLGMGVLFVVCVWPMKKEDDLSGTDGHPSTEMRRATA